MNDQPSSEAPAAAPAAASTPIPGARPVVVYAGFFRRLCGFLIDWSVLGVVAATIAAVTGGNEVGALWSAFALVYWVGLDVDGGTLGKRALGMRVVRRDGSRLNVFHAFVREIVGKPLSSLAFGFGYLWMLDNPQRQTWHDVLASSVVVRELPVQIAPAWASAPPWATGPKH